MAQTQFHVNLVLSEDENGRKRWSGIVTKGYGNGQGESSQLVAENVPTSTVGALVGASIGALMGLQAPLQ